MSVTVEIVNSSDTINQGRIKWNENDDALANQSNSLEEQQAEHIMEGHPDLNYTKAEIGALQTTQDDALETHKDSDDHDARYDAAGAAATVNGALNTHKASDDHAATYDALGAAATVNGALNTHKASDDHAATYDALGAAATVNGALNTHKASTDHDARYKAAGSVVAGMILGSGAGKAMDNSSIGLNASNELEVKDNGIVGTKILNASITTAKLEYKEYVAIISQAGTGVPSAVVLKDTIGGITSWQRSAEGYYLFNHDNLTLNKTILLFTPIQYGITFKNHLGYFHDSSNYMDIVTYNENHAKADSLLLGTLIVRVYP
jgi:hypothetical protein